MKIENINQFLDEIKKLESKNGNSIFYRGHSDKTYDLEPSIYRKDKKTNKLLYIENEDKIYRETIAKVPYDFNGKNTIESLVLMQHYGVPTRILDLTTNPLVALYFACVGNENEDGEVIVFDIPEESICYIDSDKVTILANLAKCGNNFKYEVENFSQYENKIKELENKIAKTQTDLIYGFRFSPDFRDFLKKKEAFLKDFVSNNRFYAQNIVEEIKKITSEYSERYSSEKEIPFLTNFLLLFSINTLKTLHQERTEYLNELYFKSLLNYIREDKPYFKPIINPYDIKKVLAIKPKLDNPRIVRQHGAFLIFGIQQSLSLFGKQTGLAKEMAKISSKWIKRGDSSENRIIIEKSKKESILTELDRIGINKSTLFPEIDKVADYIKDKIQKKQI